MSQLAGHRTTGEATGRRHLTSAEKAHDILCRLTRERVRLTKHLERVRDPIAEPWARCVQAGVALSKRAQACHQVGGMLSLAEWHTAHVRGID